MPRSKNKEKQKGLERRIREEEELKVKRSKAWSTYSNSENPRDRRLAELGPVGKFRN